MAWQHPINKACRKVPTWPVYVLGFVPAALYLYWGITDQLGGNPVKAMEHALGLIAFQFFLASLAITPLLRLFQINLVRFRRAIGLMAFWYLCLHLAVYVFLDLQLNWAQIGKDLTKRPYIVVGALAFLLLVPVALTSNDFSVRRLGSGIWCQVHKLVYPAVILAGVHYLWQAKAVHLELLIYLAVLAVLLLLRVKFAWDKRARRMRPAE